MKASLVFAALWANCALCAVPDSDLFAIPFNMLAESSNGAVEELYDQIPANLTSSEDATEFAVDTLDTLMRRQGQCPAGSYSCGGNRCCYTGYQCVPGSCCPNATPRQCRPGTCFNPPTQICCNDGRTCPRGYDCVSGGGCCPSGTIPCGSRKCYNPRTQTCCGEQGACDSGTSCCQSECCRNIAYCASGGRCALCPAETVTRSSTYTSITRLYYTTVTSSAPTGNAPTFSCLPMTATNDFGDTLELATNCGLKFAPSIATVTTAPFKARDVDAAPIETSPPQVKARGFLEPRQADCTPYTTLTTTRVSTTVRVSVSTYTVTNRIISTRGFSCPAMEVTNADGDTLALGTGCDLSFSPATTSNDQNIQNDPPRSGDDPPSVDSPIGGGANDGPSNDNAGAVVGLCLSLLGVTVGTVAVLGLW